MRILRLLLGAGVFGAAAGVAILTFDDRQVRELQDEVRTLEEEKTQLKQYARRLSASRRVAQVEVLRQRTDDDGRVVNTLLWQEIGEDGVLGRPVAVEAVGRLVYFEALVIKFAPEFIASGDDARGTSLALFHRIFGEQQAPETAPELDRLSRPVSDEPRSPNESHDKLWSLFWTLVDNPGRAAELGVRVAQVEAPAVPVRPGQVWELRVDAAGGVNIRKLTDSPDTTPPVSALEPEGPAGP